MIPQDFAAESALTEEVLFPAWNIVEQRPYLFSQAMRDANPRTPYEVTVSEMVFASQSNPAYFGDGQLHYLDENGTTRNASFFGGNTVAESPAMYAVFLAAEHKGIDPS